MPYFGDASGDLRGVIHGNCEVYVAGVVAGETNECRRYAKRTVDDVRDVPEARWNDLFQEQKRRLFGRLADSRLEFGVATVTSHGLHQLADAHLLYDGRFDLEWDLALRARAYTELVRRLDDHTEATRDTLTFDRVASARQSEAIRERIEELSSTLSAEFRGSRQEKEVQTADCLAGAAAADHKRDAGWLDRLGSERVVRCGGHVLDEFELRLHVYEVEP
ncbi:hypothetical protein RYH80_11745 [Halobaculum sp. MBLA0147]|uniref:hypothetical protein n=1 Tax=Halobaculum sp. MBLA0147 TaxID=3079934 RepID=UPI003524DB10